MKPFGVLHPLFVHFPFALVLTAALLEFRARRFDRETPSPHTRPLLAIAGIGAIAAAATGWITAWGRTGSDDLLFAIERHRWIGIATLVAISTAWVLYRDQPRKRRLSFARASLMLATLLVATGGHFGAELTHGRETYLRALDQLLGRDPALRGASQQEARARSAWAEAALDRWQLPTEGPIGYAEVIQPILVGRCLGCHDAALMRGGLRLDSRQRALEGGDRGDAIVAGDRAASSLWVRTSREAEDRPQMPKDEPPLPDAWIEAIGRWIDEGAEWPEPEPTPWKRTED